MAATLVLRADESGNVVMIDAVQAKSTCECDIHVTLNGGGFVLVGIDANGLRQMSNWFGLRAEELAASKAGAR